MTTTRTERITARDGGAFDGHLVLPDSGRGPGVIVLQEIFGVNSYLKEAGERLAGLGYVALLPDLYWRIEPGIALPHDEESLQQAFGYMQRLDVDQAIDDAGAALDHLRGLPEVTGGVGVLGFCLGGRLAYHVAARSSPDVAVSYYGSGIADALDEADRIECPIIFHYGDADPFIPNEQVARIRETVGGRPVAEVHVHEGAGHAFDNHEAPQFHQPEAAAAAWDLTADFLRKNLPVG